ncbi:MAG: ATP-dependent Clp protease ATP-binding subunit ClpB [Litorivivens sp.]|jgi:ATP-dependent Clp protease ATP-binding subunit ClpB
MFEKTLSTLTTKVVRLCEQLALEYGHIEYSASHILWSLCDDDLDLVSFFDDVKVDRIVLRNWALDRVKEIPKSPRYVAIPKADDSAQIVYKEVQKLGVRYGYDEIYPLDLLEAIITPGVVYSEEIMRRLPLALYEIVDWRNSKGAQAPMESMKSGGSQDGAQHSFGEGADVLDRYCENLNAKAKNGKIDPVLGRDLELKQMVEILGKRISPNIMIVGEPGVGKTSIVEGLVLRIEEGVVPERLKDAVVYELDISGKLVAGAFKGEVEERMKSVLEAIKGTEGKSILFIDEIHILLDEKGPTGSGIVNLLKPELSKGEITLIGATTQNEYQKYIEKDSAFNRRFSRLKIEEPDEITAVQMLKGLTEKYSEFHGIGIELATLPKAVSLAKKYIKDKHLPASAIELMDFTMACAVQMNATSSAVIQKVEEGLENEITESGALQNLKQNLSELLIGRFSEQEELSENVTGTISKLKEWTKAQKESVDELDLEAITAYKTGIPLGKMQTNELEKLQNAVSIIKKRVVGQDLVVEKVARGLKTFRANLKEPNEPGAIFFFTGPTGTGKTELAKAIAELLFDDEDAMIRFDMSEFQESHSVATLLGAPPGYAGYEEGGILVNNVRKHPYSVVLFDEIEKAHQDIYGIFLQMLTDGRLQDKKGKMADFSNTIIIFTSNAGAHDIVDVFNSGRDPEPDELKQILRDSGHFKDEFLGRVDSQIMPFRPITEEVARTILDIHYNKFVKLLRKQHSIELTVGDEVKDHMIEIGFSPVYGARPLKGAIKTLLTPPMADKIIMGEVGRGDRVHLTLDAEKSLVWDITKEELQEAT